MTADELKRFALLGDLHDDERCEVQDQLESRSLAEGETLFHEGEPADALVLVEAGTLRLTSRLAGEEALVGPGACLGALSLFTIGPRELSAVAEQASEVLLLSREGYRRLVADCPSAACRLGEAVLAEVAALARLVADPAARSPVDRDLPGD